MWVFSFQVVLTPKNIAIVMEYVDGGELFEYVALEDPARMRQALHLETIPCLMWRLSLAWETNEICHLFCGSLIGSSFSDYWFQDFLCSSSFPATYIRSQLLICYDNESLVNFYFNFWR